MHNVISINMIASDPAIRGGRPYILGTTVTVADVIIAHNYHRLDADGIAGWYELTLAQTHAALAYYYAHQAEMDELVRGLMRKAEALIAERPGNERSLLPR